MFCLAPPKMKPTASEGIVYNITYQKYTRLSDDKEEGTAAEMTGALGCITGTPRQEKRPPGVDSHIKITCCPLLCSCNYLISVHWYMAFKDPKSEIHAKIQ